MVIGNGLIGKSFKEKYGEREDVLIFASGVSDSREQRQAEFDREWALLKKHVAENGEGRQFIYFSTISIHDPSLRNNPYQQHKLAIEQYIGDSLTNYLIVRAPNVIGSGGNKTNLLNFLHTKIQQGEPFEVWEHAERNILDVQDLFTLVDGLIAKRTPSTTIDLVYPHTYAILEIVAVMEACLLKRARSKVVPKGASYVPEVTDLVRDLYRETGVYVNKDYLTLVVRHHFECAP